MQFADAFTLQVVQDEDLTDCYYTLGMVPFLQKLVRDVSYTAIYIKQFKSILIAKRQAIRKKSSLVVHGQNLTDWYYTVGMVPSLQKLIRDVSYTTIWRVLSVKPHPKLS